MTSKNSTFVEQDRTEQIQKYECYHDNNKHAKFANNVLLLHTFVLICFGVSVKNTAEFSTLALIFVFAPWSAGKNDEYIKDGFR